MALVASRVWWNNLAWPSTAQGGSGAEGRRGPIQGKSRRFEFFYEVEKFSFGWECSCPDHLETMAICKHVQAVPFECGERHVIERLDRTLCKFCDLPAVIRKGSRGGNPRFKCRACGKFFADNLGFEGMCNSGARCDSRQGVLRAVKPQDGDRPDQRRLPFYVRPCRIGANGLA